MKKQHRALKQAELEAGSQPLTVSAEFHPQNSSNASLGLKASIDPSMKRSLSDSSSGGAASCTSEISFLSSGEEVDNSELSRDPTPIDSSRKLFYQSKLNDRNNATLVRCASSWSDGSDHDNEGTQSTYSSALNKPHKANDQRWEAIQAARTKHGTLGLNHFRLLKRLGCGDIGSVYLVELQGSTSYFAMKVMDKESLASRKKLSRAKTEREILKSLDHPFLPSLYTHFDTEKFSCLVMEFCSGGDLHNLRQRQPGKHFTEVAARFYAAEVLLSLEYLHVMGVVYRDLKPENVLVRADGHIMLSDFDLSLRCMVRPTLVKSASVGMDPHKRLAAYNCVEPDCLEPVFRTPACSTPSCIQPSSFLTKMLRLKKKKPKLKRELGSQVNPLPELIAEPTGARSLSFVGTHEYLAPEIIKGEGHGSAVDWWTFGIFLYEMLYGRTPFKGGGNKATLFNVIGQHLKFPETTPVSFAARDLIRGLLAKDPEQRTGNKRGATEIKQHPFFEGVNWALIRSMAPPEVPKTFEMPATSSQDRRPGEGESKSSGTYLDFELF
ncbi:hypothetical protein GOP47_0004911 [Adiantum capillus-veneris]|uniref:non-specific serine/threonine protein kinase n=1 Tax=Adiantum capillus-veneris TaxID=13818 RepID=A0A9D4ZMQ8_ADICA|nr:hypothetical protein GOP47_0004911 [Adiantum capillus-veneris]